MARYEKLVAMFSLAVSAAGAGLAGYGHVSAHELRRAWEDGALARTFRQAVAQAENARRCVFTGSLMMMAGGLGMTGAARLARAKKEKRVTPG